MIGLRIHPGYAVLTTVALVAGALIIFQNRQGTPSAPAASAHRDDAAQSKPSVSGAERVIDGATIDIHDTRVRLNGIDAPETKRTCVANDKKYQCGLETTEALIQLIDSNTVRCEQTGTDRNSRVIGLCVVG